MADNTEEAQSQVESKPRKRWIVLLVIPVLALGAGMAGAVLGPRLAGVAPEQAPAADGEDSEEHDSEESSGDGESASHEGGGKVVRSLELEPLIVDVRDAENLSHHIKIRMTLELKEGVPDEEVERYTPRGRQAAIAYFRSKTYDELTAPGRFESVVKELSDVVLQEYGKKRVTRLVITDYVSQ